MSSSFLHKDITVTPPCRPIIDTNLFRSNTPLPIVDNKYSFTRARYALASLITSIKILEPPSFWCNLFGNGAGSFYELLRLEDCVFNLY